MNYSTLNNPLHIEKNNLINNDIELNDVYIRPSINIQYDDGDTIFILNNEDDVFPITDDILFKSLGRYNHVTYFLYLTCMIPIKLLTLDTIKELSLKDNIKNIFYSIYYILFRLFFFITLIISITVYIPKCFEKEADDSSCLLPTIQQILADVTIIVMIYNIYYINNLLKLKSPIINLPYYSENVGYNYKFAILFILLELPYSYSNIHHGNYIHIYYINN